MTKGRMYVDILLTDLVNSFSNFLLKCLNIFVEILEINVGLVYLSFISLMVIIFYVYFFHFPLVEVDQRL